MLGGRDRLLMVVVGADPSLFHQELFPTKSLLNASERKRKYLIAGVGMVYPKKTGGNN